jgi:hypothetical protein
MGESSGLRRLKGNGLDDKFIAENQKLRYAWLMSNPVLPHVGSVAARPALRMQPKKREEKLFAL